MDQPSLEERAMREAHVNKLVSFSALMRIKRLVDERKNDEKAQRRVAKAYVIVAGAFATVVVVLCLFDAAIFSALARRVMAVFR